MRHDPGADPAGTIETYRKGVLSMSGIVVELAKWRAVFPEVGRPRLVPYCASTLAPPTAEDVRAMDVPEAAE
jgi:hypothetical protein